MVSQTNWALETRVARQFLNTGRIPEAVNRFREIARFNPNSPDAHNNLAVALKANGELNLAVAAYKKALRIAPDHSVTLLNISRVFRELGNHNESLANLFSLIKRKPNNDEVNLELYKLFKEMPLKRPSTLARQILLFLFEYGRTEMQTFVEPVIRLLSAGNNFRSIIESAERVYPRFDLDSVFPSKHYNDPLLMNLLLFTVVAVPAMEKWLTVFRAQLLQKAINGDRIDINEALLWSVTAQFHTTEHAQVLSSEELIGVERLASALQPGDGAAIPILGMYRSLDQIPAARHLWSERGEESTNGSPKMIVLRRALEDKVRERELAETIPKLREIIDVTSVTVRGQYEDNPYPKWLNVTREVDPLTLGERLQRRFDDLSFDELDLDAPRILIAGSGTGRHAVQTAARHKGSQVLAIDLSVASLAYAKRQSVDLAQKNIRFMQADILSLGDIEERFDVVECTGVLHHMAQPLNGWRVLLELLKPTGLMRIGLYSETFRKMLVPYQDTSNKNESSESTRHRVRQHRAAMIAAPPDGIVAGILRSPDFYSMSGCRDMLMHSHELSFTLPEIEKTLGELALQFMGFENLDPFLVDEFRRINTAPQAERNLALWNEFEAAHPQTFASMYQFWCQRI